MLSAKLGGTNCVTVTLKLPPAVLPQLSVADAVTVVVPIVNVLPEAAEVVTDRLAPNTSVALGAGLKVTAAPAAEVAFAV